MQDQQFITVLNASSLIGLMVDYYNINAMEFKHFNPSQHLISDYVNMVHNTALSECSSYIHK
jgi:hypothetical protein